MRTLMIPAAMMAMMMTACDGPPGSDGADGVDGTDGLSGEDGTDGTDGTDGEDGTDGTDGTDGEHAYGEPSALTVTIDGVAVSGAPVVSFTVVDQDGNPYSGIDQDLIDARGLRFTVAKLIPAADGSGDADVWQSYVNTEADTTDSTAGPDGVPVLTTAIQASYESDGTLEYAGEGAYTYTFATDITAVTDPMEVTYEETYLHRVAIQMEVGLSDGEELILNPTMDWVPSGDDAPATRDIVHIDSCNECHGELSMHGGGRVDTDYCVTCHNPGTTDPNSGLNLAMAPMIHSVHMGADLGEDYVIWGYRDGEHDYGHVGYPQDITNCAKCHTGDDEATPDGDNWMNRPSTEACESCHTEVDLVSGDGHTGGAQADNAMCSTCHDADAITDAHVTENATENNPNVRDGQYVVEYELVSASVDGDNDLTVELKITVDGTEVDLSNLPSDIEAEGRYPSLLLAYALAQGNNDSPADFNNLGMDSGLPDSASLDPDGGDATFSYSSGTNTVVVADAFPEGAMLRTVGMQGYFRQTDPEDSEEYISLHAVSRVLTVDGDDARREVVDAEKCSSCHEWFEGHGGNRVYTVQVCTLCHNPNLSSSGTEIDLSFPESSMHFPNLVHGIHGAEHREAPLDFVRNRSGGTHYTFISEDMLEDYPDGHVVTFPGEVGNCETCHSEGTYLPESVPENALEASFVVGTDATSIEEVATDRETVPNEADLVSTATTTACGGCHDAKVAAAHMEHNGGAVMWDRGTFNADEPYETCTICHAEGRTGDVSAMHPVK
jgi:OmcA/MtrC family decaheme c-type cytochrome